MKGLHCYSRYIRMARVLRGISYFNLGRCTKSNDAWKYALRVRAFGGSSTVYSKAMKVAVLGAAGKTGTCMSLCLKQSPLIDELAIYDTVPVNGLIMDLSHLDTKCKTVYCPEICGTKEELLAYALDDAKIVMIAPEGKEIKKLRSTFDILEDNARFLCDIIPNIVRYCPRALIALAAPPINSLFPVLLEYYKRAGLYDHNRLFGVTTLDCVRASTFAAKTLAVEPECVTVPVIGGSCKKTRVPLFLRTKPCNEFTYEELARLTYAVKAADEDLAVDYNGSADSPAVALGFAAARFCISLCKAMQNEAEVIECAYVRSCVIPELRYFASPLKLGPDGIQKHLGLPPLCDHECKNLAAAIPHLRRAVELGVKVANRTTCRTTTETSPPYRLPCHSLRGLPAESTGCICNS